MRAPSTSPNLASFNHGPPPQLLHNAATKLYDASGNVTCTVFGVTGFTRDMIQAFLEACPVHADRRPRKLGERPPPHPIMVERAFFQCQVCAGRQVAPGARSAWLLLGWPACAACSHALPAACLSHAAAPPRTQDRLPLPFTAPRSPAHYRRTWWTWARAAT